MKIQLKFRIEHQYQLYLERMKLWPESKMHPEQRKQLKQAFYGGVAQMLVLMRYEIAELTEEEGVEVLENMTREAEDYWTNEAATKN